MTPADRFLHRIECRLRVPLAFFLGFSFGWLVFNPLISELRRLW